MIEEGAYAYIVASRRNGTIYLGSTDNLARRGWEHRNGVVPGLTKKYGCTPLVWYEPQGSLESARRRAFQMKQWKRAWKLREIEGLNPGWDDPHERIALP